MQLETDLKNELNVKRLEYLVISGDIANHSTEAEYKAAFELVDGLVKRFGLNAERVVIVPGNHDLNQQLSKKAYPFIYNDELTDPLPEGMYIPAGDAGVLLRDDELYQKRFEHFSTQFYKKVYGSNEYPLDYAEQSMIIERYEDKMLFLALNSCWQIDHHFQQRAGINMDALSRALDRLQGGKYDDWLKIAVWHHPVTGKEMMNAFRFVCMVISMKLSKAFINMMAGVESTLLGRVRLVLRLRNRYRVFRCNITF